MRIATWNVNSLKVRMPRVEEWLTLRLPDILLMQETKLGDDAAPIMAFGMAGYALTHHGEGRWNGVAIASREPPTDVSLGFEGKGPDADGARFLATRVGGIRYISIYAPNGRALDTPFYSAKLDWYRRLLAWLERNEDPSADVVLGGDFNVAPTDIDVYDPAEYVGTTHTSDPEREAFRRCSTGASSTRIGPFIRSRASSPGGITEPATSTKDSGCGSITCWSRARSRPRCRAPRSTGMRGRASCRPIMPRCGSTWMGRRRRAGAQTQVTLASAMEPAAMLRIRPERRAGRRGAAPAASRMAGPAPRLWSLIAGTGAAGFLLVAAAAGVALAQATLIVSSPADGTVLQSPPTAITATFSEPLDPTGSSIELLGADGKSLGRGTIDRSNTSGTGLRLDLETSLGPGTYRVGWVTVALASGVQSNGSFAFVVAGPGQPAAVAASPGASGSFGSGSPDGTNGLLPLLTVVAGAVVIAAVLLARRRGGRDGEGGTGEPAA